MSDTLADLERRMDAASRAWGKLPRGPEKSAALKDAVRLSHKFTELRDKLAWEADDLRQRIAALEAENEALRGEADANGWYNDNVEPEQSGEFLVTDGDSWYVVAVFDRDFGDWFWGGRSICVNYWRPLPPSPEADDGAE